MSNILVKVENREAEKLWSYLLTYERMVRKAHEVTESPGGNVALGVIPTFKHETNVPKQKRSIKRRCST